MAWEKRSVRWHLRTLLSTFNAGLQTAGISSQEREKSLKGCLSFPWPSILTHIKGLIQFHVCARYSVTLMSKPIILERTYYFCLVIFFFRSKRSINLWISEHRFTACVLFMLAVTDRKCICSQFTSASTAWLSWMKISSACLSTKRRIGLSVCRKRQYLLVQRSYSKN
jgi:hypothetical protein